MSYHQYRIIVKDELDCIITSKMVELEVNINYAIHELLNEIPFAPGDKILIEED